MFKSVLAFIGGIEDEELLEIQYRAEEGDASQSLGSEKFIPAVHKSPTLSTVDDLKKKLETIPTRSILPKDVAKDQVKVLLKNPIKNDAKDVVKVQRKVKNMNKLILNLDPKIISPNDFSDAKLVADEFLDKNSVLMDLTGSDNLLSRRLIDFASGVCYSQHAKMVKITLKIFLIHSKDLKVSKQDIDGLVAKYH